MSSDVTTQPRERVRRVGGFRRGAPLLALVALPLLGGWLLEGNALSGSRPASPDQTEAAVIAAHRIAGWLLPLMAGGVFTYGISRTEPDVRLVAMGMHDPRWVWLWRWLPVACTILALEAGVALALSLWSGESMPRLIGATLSASAFALAVGYAVSTVSGAAPGAGAFATVAIVVATMLVPPQAGLDAPLSLSPGPLGWRRGEPYAWWFAVHALLVVALATAITVGAASLPRDIRDVRWIARFRASDA